MTSIIRFLFFSLIFVFFLSSCSVSKKSSETKVYYPGSGKTSTGSTSTKTSTKRSSTTGKVDSRAKTFIAPVDVDRDKFVKYAKTLLGTPYTYGSTVPSKGLDCSGFVYNVFQHFNVSCPRVTNDYTWEGREVSRSEARPGDIILFTGSDHSSGVVGHMGIITENNGDIMFVHSASGKRVGVILNKLSGYYENHFVKIISVLR